MPCFGIYGVTSGYRSILILPLDFGVVLFAVERTNLDALNSNLWYSFFSLQVALFITFKVTSDSIKKSIVIWGGNIILLRISKCKVCRIEGSTQRKLLQNVEGINSSLRVLRSSWQLKYSSCVSWFNSDFRSINCCSILCSF